MEFCVLREVLLGPLQLVVSVVEKRQTYAILSHVLLLTKADKLILTGSNLEVELQAQVPLLAMVAEGEITVSARKLLDICRLLPEGSQISFKLQDSKVAIKTEQGSYSLASLAAADYPRIELRQALGSVQLKSDNFLILLKKTCFAMAQNDVRFFLNGLCLKFNQTFLEATATNGHRLATSTIALEKLDEALQSIILPRKAVLELMRLLEQSFNDISLQVGENFLTISAGCYQFVSKLVEGRFPVYKKMAESEQTKHVLINKQSLKACLVRVAILSDEKHRGIFGEFNDKQLKLYSDNTQQERAEEVIDIEYAGEKLTICVNVDYLLDVLNTLGGDIVRISITDAETGILFEDPEDEDSSYVIMPMKL